MNDPLLASRVLDTHDTYVIAGTFLNGRRDLAAAATIDPARRLLNPGLRSCAVQPLADLVRLSVSEAFAVGVPSARIVDPLPILERATSLAVARFYFADSASTIDGLVAPLLDALGGVFGNPMSLPKWVPTRANLRVRRAYAALRSGVIPLVRSLVVNPGSAPCFAAQVAETALRQGHSPSRVADLLIGSLLAAQRVPAAGAAWALWRLAENPELVEEARGSREVLGSVALEAMRLHPPTWVLHRTASRAVRLGGHLFGRGHNFLVSPYVIHRDPELFRAAAIFDHRRWVDPGHRSSAFCSSGADSTVAPVVTPGCSL
ncbi:cytochrome P450 [Nocardioides piscis]|uniref:Cytochrome P450 n=1 Tax=Nocardioides piscis TaxID=2714938 RepID=A0A6G7YDJ6_9ACTN|nr:cytochrome P450 [Nocardioides piscis]QIK74892.1 cytochrome P450 [Nocardioides piscis]